MNFKGNRHCGCGSVGGIGVPQFNQGCGEGRRGGGIRRIMQQLLQALNQMGGQGQCGQQGGCGQCGGCGGGFGGGGGCCGGFPQRGCGCC